MSEGETSPIIDITPVATPEPATAEPDTNPVIDTSDTPPTDDSETSGPTSDDPTSDDEEDNTEDPSIKEKAELKRNLDEKVAQVGDTIENSTTNDFVEKLAGTDPAQREQFARDNRGKQALRTRHLVKTLSKLEDGKIHQISTDPTGVSSRYRTTDGKGITGIIRFDSTSDTVTCRVANAGSSSEISMSRAELLDLMYQTDKALILESYPPEDRPLMEKYYAGLSGKEKTDEHYKDLPEMIVQVAERHWIPTTNMLVHAGERYFAAKVPPAGATPEVVAQITAENVQNAQRLAELKSKLGENNLATAEQLRSTMELVGLTPAALSRTLESVRSYIPQIETRLKLEKDEAKRDELKTQLDSLRATADIYAEAQKMLDPADTDGAYIQKFMESQRAGGVSSEFSKSIIQHIQNGEIDAVVKMVSPETSISKTTEEKKKLREVRERNEKILKGVGIAAALAALLLALGISQGAKQQ